MTIRLVSTCLAGVALALAGFTALAGARDEDGVQRAAHTQAQIDQALEAIGPQDPAVMAGIVAGCRELIGKGLTSAPCADLLKQIGRAPR